MKKFEFIITTPPNEECIQNFHKALAQGLINKHGVDLIKKVLETINSKKIE